MTQAQLEVLSESAIFRGMNTEQIQRILSSQVFRLKSFEKGSLIAQSGNECNFAIVILEGMVAGEMMDFSGRVLKIEDMTPPTMIAPAFLYGKKRVYPVNVTASETAVLWMMHRDDFSRLLQSELILLDNYLNAISNRAQFLSEKLRFLSFPTLRAKLAFYLLHHAPNKEVFKLPVTHQQLSELFGVARPSLSREIRELNKQGLIESERDMIKLINLPGLRNLIREN